MKSEHWEQVEAIYHSALEVEAAERADYLAVACAGDEALRREVLSLLSSAERADSFLEEPVMSLGLALMQTEYESLAGQTVGRFRLLELIGRGGMGEVYLAHDPRLDRRVALKLLPAGSDGDRRHVSRFEQEARAASAISHPNVAHIYEIGEERGRRYIAMEYVRGQTLRELMKRGQMEVRDALDVAIQTAAALAAAHEAGVVHRDIKPENIMLRDDGYVKVLDFGLAKLIETRTGAPGPEAAPFPSLHTEPELLMGTSEYMAPEQVRRQPADERTDLWGLGVVLYEMLAGRRPFRREDGEVIVAILEREPEPLGDLRPGLPPALLNVVSKSLLKCAQGRHESAQVLMAELRRVRQMIEAETPAAAAGDGPPAEGPPPRRGPVDPPTSTAGEFAASYGGPARTENTWAGALLSARVMSLRGRWRPVHWLVLLLLSGAILSAVLLRQRPRTLQDAELNLRFERLNLSGSISDIALSPDGKYVASVIEEEGKKAIHIRELATASDLRIAPPSEEGYSGLSFSPDGTYVYYLQNQVETGALYRVSKFGGSQRKILDGVNTAATFSPDGTRLAFVRSNPTLDTPDLIVARADGSGERLLARRTLADAYSFRSDMKRAGPVWSPDGKVLACPTFSLLSVREMGLEVVDAETGVGRRLGAKTWYDISRMTWLADGSGLVVAAAEAPGAPWQLQLLAYPSGVVRKATADPNNYTLVSGARDSSLFLTLNVEENASVWRISVAEGGRPEVSEVSQRKGVAEVLWGRAGRFIYTVGDGNFTNLWEQGTGTSARQLTFEADNLKPAESPDGNHLVFVSTRGGAMNIWRTDADGTRPLRLTRGGYEDVPSVTPDGRWVIYRTGNSIEKVLIDGGKPIKLLDKSALCPALSPDGRLLAFFTNDTPESQVWHIEVYDLNTLGRVHRFDLPKATTPFNGLRLTPDNRLRWTPDGRGLSYVSSAGGAANVWVQPLAGGEPWRLTDFRDGEIPSFAWSPDGQQLACVRHSRAYVPVLVRLF